MTRSQAEQFNRMRNALISIHKEFMTPKQIFRNSEKAGLEYAEYLEMAYENIQQEARQAVKGVKEVVE